MKHDCSGNRDQYCIYCNEPLVCDNDYTAGGSHYWTLHCQLCGTTFYYDTYRFKLSREQDFVAMGVDMGLTRLVDFVKLAESVDRGHIPVGKTDTTGL